MTLPAVAGAAGASLGCGGCSLPFGVLRAAASGASPDIVASRLEAAAGGKTEAAAALLTVALAEGERFAEAAGVLGWRLAGAALDATIDGDPPGRVTATALVEGVMAAVVLATPSLVRPRAKRAALRVLAAAAAGADMAGTAALALAARVIAAGWTGGEDRELLGPGPIADARAALTNLTHKNVAEASEIGAAVLAHADDSAEANAPALALAEELEAAALALLAARDSDNETTALAALAASLATRRRQSDRGGASWMGCSKLGDEVIAVSIASAAFAVILGPGPRELGECVIALASGEEGGAQAWRDLCRDWSEVAAAIPPGAGRAQCRSTSPIVASVVALCERVVRAVLV